MRQRRRADVLTHTPVLAPYAPAPPHQARFSADHDLLLGGDDSRDASPAAAHPTPPAIRAAKGEGTRLALRVQSWWRMHVARYVHSRLALVLATPAADEAVQNMEWIIQALAQPRLEPDAEVRGLELFEEGLGANRAGHTLRACELMQNAALLRPRLNIVLSVANMRLKLGQPAVALLAYEHALASAEATEKQVRTSFALSGGPPSRGLALPACV